MRIDLDAYMDKDSDGFSGSVRLSRDEITDIYELADMFTEAAKAMGFSYIKAVGFEKDDGQVVWGDF